jgi:hypothetical protein
MQKNLRFFIVGLQSRSSLRSCPQGERGPPSLKLRRDSLRSPLTTRAKTGGKGIRTPDFQLAKLALYQLSYAPCECSILDWRLRIANDEARTSSRVPDTRTVREPCMSASPRASQRNTRNPVGDHLRFRCLKLEINKRHWTGRWKEFEDQKCQDVCRDLNARRLQSQAINKLIAFLGNSQE